MSRHADAEKEREREREREREKETIGPTRGRGCLALKYTRCTPGSGAQLTLRCSRLLSLSRRAFSFLSGKSCARLRASSAAVWSSCKTEEENGIHECTTTAVTQGRCTLFSHRDG